MKIVMKVLFVLFVIAIITYITRADIFGPRILLEKDEPLNFTIGDQVEDWNEYFKVIDAKDGELEDKYMDINAQEVNLNQPGVQYIYISAQDKTGNKSTRTFEVNVSSGYEKLDFEQFAVHQTLVTNDFAAENLQANASGYGAQTTEMSNASITNKLGSKNLNITIDKSDGKENGIDQSFELRPYNQYYLQYNLKLDDGVKLSPGELIYLPILTNSELGQAPVELAINDDYQLVVIDNENDETTVIENTNLKRNIATITMNVSMDNKLGNPDKVDIYFNDQNVNSIIDIDYKTEDIDQLNLTVSSNYHTKDTANVYLDDLKISMVKNDIFY